MTVVAMIDLKRRAEDYERVAAAIRFLDQHAADQPELAEVAASVGLSPFHFQRLFSRWTGISPKQFLGYLTLSHARDLLGASESVLATALDTGLSGPSRLHDLFVTFDAVTPGEFKRGGAGLDIRFGAHPTPFGTCLLLTTERGVCGLSFVNGSVEEALAEARARWPAADFREAAAETGAAVRWIFGGPEDRSRPLHAWIRGTNFQIKVWEALLTIPEGGVTTYGEVCDRIGRPGAARAVGQAVGANPVSILIPCHRVIRETGAVGGYAWGPERKRALLAWEAARADAGAGVAK